MVNYTSSSWGLNENGEIVAVAGTGTSNIVGFVAEDILPVDAQGRLVIAGLGGGQQTSSSQLVYVKDYMVGRTDAAALSAADAAAPLGGTLVLEANRTYNIASQVSFQNAGEVVGNGAVIKPAQTLIASGAASAVTWGKSLATYSAFTPFTITANSRQFAIPAGVTLAVGDVIWLRGKNTSNAGFVAADTYVASKANADPNNRTTADYFHGMMAIVTALIGGNAEISTPAYATFPVYAIYKYRGFPQMKVSNLTIDLSNSDASCTNYFEGLSIVGSNIDVTGVRVIGNEYGIVGLSIAGENAVVRNSLVRGFLNIQGQGTSGANGRVGYGVLNNANNFTLTNSTVADCKHEYSSGSHYQVTNNAVIQNCLIYEDGSLSYTLSGTATNIFEGSLDYHCGVTGKQRVHLNYVVGNDRLFSLRNRNGGLDVTSNTLITTNVSTSGGIFSGTEVGFEGIVFDNNDVFFAPGSVLGLFGVGGTYGSSDYIDVITNVRITNNRFSCSGVGTGGWLFNITRSTLAMDKIYIDGNYLYNLKGVFSVIGGSQATPATLTMRDWTISNTTLDACDQIAYLNTETATATQLTNWIWTGIRFINAANTSSTVHAVNLATPSPNSRNNVISNFIYDDVLIDMSSAAVNNSSNYAWNIATSLTNARFSNSMILRNGGSGNARSALLQTLTLTDVKFSNMQMDTDLQINSQFIGQYSALSQVEFHGCRFRAFAITETTPDIRLTNVNFIDNTFGSFTYTARAGSTAWSGNTSTDVHFSGCRFLNVGGDSIKLSGDVGLAHRFRFMNCGMTRGLNDVTGTYYGKPVGNYTVNGTSTTGVTIASTATGTTTVFTVVGLNSGANNTPILRVGDVVITNSITGTSAGLLNGIPLVVTAVTDAASSVANGTFTVNVTTAATLSGGFYSREPYVWWKGNTVVQATGDILGTAAPIAGTWKLGDSIKNPTPTSGGYEWLICTTGGTPGTWKTSGLIS